MASRLPAPQRRRQLLDCAMRVFAEQGFHSASMNDIAEVAGVTKPVLYQHFGSKRELYIELLSDIGTVLGETIAKAAAEAETPRQRVERGVAAYFGFVAEQRDAYRMLFGSGTRQDKEFSVAVEEVEATIADMVAAMIDVADIDPNHRRLLAHGIVGLAEGTSRYWISSGDRSVDAELLAAQVAQLAWSGLRGIG